MRVGFAFGLEIGISEEIELVSWEVVVDVLGSGETLVFELEFWGEVLDDLRVKAKEDVLAEVLWEVDDELVVKWGVMCVGVVVVSVGVIGIIIVICSIVVGIV